MKNVKSQFRAGLPLEGEQIHLREHHIRDIIRETFKGIRKPDPRDLQAHMLQGAPGSGKTTTGQEIYARLPENCFVFVSADERGVMDKIPEYRDGIKGASPEERHRLWQKYQSDADLVRSLILDKAMAEGYSVFLDTTGSGDKGVATARKLAEFGYQLTMHSFWAPLDVCARRVQDRIRQADPRYLVTKRIDAYKSFARVWQAATSMHLYYSSGERPAPGEVLDITKVDLLDTPFKMTSLHKHLLGRMLTELPRRECDEASLRALSGVTTITPEEIGTLKDNAKALQIVLEALVGKIAIYPPRMAGVLRPV